MFLDLMHTQYYKISLNVGADFLMKRCLKSRSSTIVHVCLLYWNSLKIEEERSNSKLYNYRQTEDLYVFVQIFSELRECHSYLSAFYIKPKHSIIGKGRNAVFLKTRHLPWWPPFYTRKWDRPFQAQYFLWGENLYMNLWLNITHFIWRTSLV